MLSNISWGNYFIAVTVLILAWYFFIGLKFYYRDFKDILSGDKKIKIPFKKVNKRSYAEPHTTLREVEELSNILIKATEEYAEKKSSHIEYKNYIKLTFDEYPLLKDSSERVKINQLVVTLSGKYPHLQLTYTDVDSLWDQDI
ncbi:hypothetical protein CLU81_5202 [Flavobacterium sp. 9]|uniref:hypothetical protein n=1 Tax=Flavobacterium sp. 9 TaxID=2035198 RepID=UPI000C194071|nr:hypothetical protein [Flavobacterium sp. 9]PIF34546.1 hypothetical protein CLU81_5202 [Flavobacterium sp. 9]